MKLKYYLRGLGVGIICTAIIMGIAMSGKEKLTDAEIIERARILGMVMAEEQNEEEEPQDDSGDKTTQEEQNKKENDSKNAENNQIPEVKNEEPQTPQTPEEPQQTEPQQAAPEIKTIEVQRGEYSDVVSQKLYEAGLIPDPAAFNKYLTDSGLDQSIMVGVHQIPMGASQEEIIKILGEKPQ